MSMYKTLITAISVILSVQAFSMPVQTDTIKSVRGDTENRFLDELRAFEPQPCRIMPEFSEENLLKAGDNLYILPGEQYVITEVTGSSYLSKDENGELQFVENSSLPEPTIANMVVVGNNYVANIELKVLKHEYGESETLTLQLEQLLQFCQSQGCKVYWGLDQKADDKLTGTIFCYNPEGAYDHVFRVEMNPAEIGKEDFTMRGVASLFIPTDNVANLFAD